jgi:hypothetical protein
MKLLYLIVALLSQSCLQETISPEGTLKEFIESRMGQTVTREYILDKVTGKMRQSIENISDEEFKKFADLKNVQQNSFKVLSKSCQENKCFLTYSISFKTNVESSHFQSEVKKIAEIQLVDGRWLIAEVSNVKTYHEAMEPINALE